ncbi:hypothetical protein PGB90_005062 [Kerria lacca]
MTIEHSIKMLQTPMCLVPIQQPQSKRVLTETSLATKTSSQHQFVHCSPKHCNGRYAPYPIPSSSMPSQVTFSLDAVANVSVA